MGLKALFVTLVSLKGTDDQDEITDPVVSPAGILVAMATPFGGLLNTLSDLSEYVLETVLDAVQMLKNGKASGLGSIPTDA